MGNQKSFTPNLPQNYKIVHSDEPQSSSILQDISTHEQFLRKTIKSQDPHFQNQLQFIINEKINDPSPFVNKLVEFYSQTQETYCSKQKNFVLLFKYPHRFLINEIQYRNRENIPFNSFQISQVIDHVAKALLYLNQFHEEYIAISTNSISWPTSSESQIQLLDPWAVVGPPIKVYNKNKQRDENCSEHENNLYCLGMTVLEMLSQKDQSAEQRINGIKDQRVRRKLNLLLSDHPSQRNLVYQVIGKQTPKFMQSTKSSIKQLEPLNFIPMTQKIQRTPTSSLSMESKPKPSFNQQPKLQPTFSQNKPQMTFNQPKIQSTFNQPQQKPSFHQQPKPQPQFQPSYQSQPQPQSQSKSQPQFAPSKPAYNFSQNSIQYTGNFDKKVKINYEDTKVYPEKFIVPITAQKNSSNLFTPPELMKYISNESVEEPKEQQKSVKKVQNPVNPVNLVNAEIPANIGNEVEQKFSPISENAVSVNEKSSESQSDQIKITSSIKYAVVNYEMGPIQQRSQRSHSLSDDDDEKQVVIEYYDNGSRYEGEKMRGMRNGQGKFFYQEGSFYDGQWKNNKMNGFGKLYYGNGSLAYEGQWYLDEFHGFGKVFNDNCIVEEEMFDYKDFNYLGDQWKFYQGNLESDSKEGFGKIVLGNGEEYQGNFREDKPNGEGKFTRKNGEVIYGIWNDSVLQKIL